MEAYRIRPKRRNNRCLQAHSDRIPASLLIMVFGYLFGCVIGILVAISADVEWMRSYASGLVAQRPDGLFTIFCGCAAYGLGMLFLATSYLGFFLIPGVFSVKGFLSSSVFTACFRGNLPNGFQLACLELFLPGVFLLPAMLILGQCCMRWSVRLLRCRLGEFIPPDPSSSRAIGAALVLFLMASAVKAYLVPYILDLF